MSADGFELIRIEMGNGAMMARWESLLSRCGIRPEPMLDETLCLVSPAGQLAATGSFLSSTLRCLAVDPLFREEGLMGAMINALCQRQAQLGRTRLFLYTREASARIFASMGFFRVAAAAGAVLMENRRDGLSRYISSIERGRGVGGAVVLNANPFTLGHRYLVEKAVAGCDTLHIFVVSEDVSQYSFKKRLEMVKLGVADIPNALVHETGDYMISSATFPSYFLKNAGEVPRVQGALDAEVFAKIANETGITVRFVGEEPLCPSTAIYNKALGEILPQRGVELRQLKRFCIGGQIVSASRFRALMLEGRQTEARALVPQSTWERVCAP